MKFVIITFLFVAVSAHKPMNFVIFNPDEMRAESLGCYGNEVAKTPNFDSFASQGTRFEQCHTTYTVCSQSRASFMTGWYTHVRGHRSLWHLLHNDEPNLLRYLKKAGYTVNWWGKNDLLAADSFNSSVSSAMHMGGPQNGGNSFRFGEAGYYSFLSNAYNGNWNETSDYNNVAEAVKFLETKPTKPFMIYLPLIKPHPPYSAPEPFHSLIDPKDIPDLRPWGLDKKPDYHELIRKHRNLTSLDVDFFKKLQAVYMGSISYSDHLFGILLKALEDNGYADSTAVFVFADHGDYAGDYGLVEKWPSGLEDVLTRVPLLVRVPGGASNHVVREQVQHMDIVATILHLANVTAQHVHFSEDLTPILMGGFGDVDRAVYSEGGYSTHEPLDFEGRCKDPEQSGKCNPQQIYYPKGLQQQMEPLSVCRSVMIRTLTHKLVLRSDPKDFDHCSELYDLQKDPRELKNVYNESEYAQVQQQLKQQLLIWYMQTSDVTPYAEDSRGYFPPHNHSFNELQHFMGLGLEATLNPQTTIYTNPVESSDLLHQYYRRTPAGYVLKECVHDIPAGASVVVEADSFLVLHPRSDEPVRYSKCGAMQSGLPMMLSRVHESYGNSFKFPKSYNGWLAYAAYNSSSGFSYFWGNFTVPDFPDEKPEVLYLFTGLQNKDWIPLVDPKSESVGFDIIQPVLQYPCEHNKGWCVRSWYVTTDGGVMVSSPVGALPGSYILANMTKIGEQEWYVGSTVEWYNTTDMRVSHKRLMKQSWAYTTLEGYGIKGCSYYPHKSCSFVDMVLYSSNGTMEVPKWRANPKPNPKPECHETVTINSSSRVVISFGNEK